MGQLVTLRGSTGYEKNNAEFYWLIKRSLTDFIINLKEGMNEDEVVGILNELLGILPALFNFLSFFGGRPTRRLGGDPLRHGISAKVDKLSREDLESISESMSVYDMIDSERESLCW